MSVPTRRSASWLAKARVMNCKRALLIIVSYWSLQLTASCRYKVLTQFAKE